MTQKREEATFLRWKDMVQNRVLPREHMEMMPFREYDHDSDGRDTRRWFEKLVPNFASLPAEGDKPASIAYTSFGVSTPHYLAYLVRTLLEPPQGSGLHKAEFHRIPAVTALADVCAHPAVAPHYASSNAESNSPLPLLVNATGLGSLKLRDVADNDVYPIRGQTILLSSPRTFTKSPRCIMVKGKPKPIYVIPRAASGLVILGGTFDEGDWGRDARSDDTERILRECLDVCPELLEESDEEQSGASEAQDRWKRLEKQIVRINVGTRPARKGETRVELDAVKANVDGSAGPSQTTWLPVLHAYGAGPAGYQGSVGIAIEAADWADKHFAQGA